MGISLNQGKRGPIFIPSHILTVHESFQKLMKLRFH